MYTDSCVYVKVMSVFIFIFSLLRRYSAEKGFTHSWLALFSESVSLRQFFLHALEIRRASSVCLNQFQSQNSLGLANLYSKLYICKFAIAKTAEKNFLTFLEKNFLASLKKKTFWHWESDIAANKSSHPNGNWDQSPEFNVYKIFAPFCYLPLPLCS
jgi:hypothetical protein